jgi:hypothetical protein
MSAPREKKVQDIVDAPVVSDDPTSQEAILARQAKTIEAQSAADSTYDTVIERFSDSSKLQSCKELSIPLVVVTIAAGLLLLPLFFASKRRLR